MAAGSGVGLTTTEIAMFFAVSDALSPEMLLIISALKMEVIITRIVLSCFILVFWFITEN